MNAKLLRKYGLEHRTCTDHFKTFLIIVVLLLPTIGMVWSLTLYWNLSADQQIPDEFARRIGCVERDVELIKQREQERLRAEQCKGCDGELIILGHGTHLAPHTCGWEK